MNQLLALHRQLCTVPGCDKPSFARKWCHTHYEHWRRRGTPVYVAPSDEDRFWKFVDRRDSGCWEWTGALLPSGYGIFRFDARQSYAHRFSFGHFVEPIAAGLEVDHLCRNRKCVNPAHLEAVTPAENMRRTAVNRTHCKHGHPFSGDNLYVHAGFRYCRECRREASRTRKRRRKEEAAA